MLAGLDDRFDAEEALDRVDDCDSHADDMTVCLLSPRSAAGDGTVTEELELEPGCDPKGVAAFLLACGLDEGEVELALTQISARTEACLVRGDAWPRPDHDRTQRRRRR